VSSAARTSVAIGAIVLAAGASRRMGTNKLLLAVEGEPMVRRTVRRALDAGCAPVIVVTGHEHERVESALVGLEVTCVRSPEPTGPTSASLHAGLRALPTECDATVVMLADMVQVTAPMVRAMLDSAKETPAPLVVSQYGDVNAPPLLFRLVLWPELLAWSGEGCGKQVVNAHRAEAVMLAWPEEALQDVDTPADYEAVR
jgi:molybdenum cofactor cytidylyltransferase